MEIVSAGDVGAEGVDVQSYCVCGYADGEQDGKEEGGWEEGVYGP